MTWLTADSTNEVEMFRRRADVLRSWDGGGVGGEVVVELADRLGVSLFAVVRTSTADAHAIMRQTGHRSHAVLEAYAREHAPLVGNAVTRIGL